MNICCFERTLAIDDYFQLLSLVEAQMRFIGYDMTKSQVKAAFEHAMREGGNAILWVAYDEQKKATGFAFANTVRGLECEGDYLWLNELYVDPERRTQGMGRALLERVRQDAKSRGCTYMAMVTHPKNQRAQHLYEHAGFELEELVWVDTYL